MKTESAIEMKGQEKYTCGLELQWVMGIDGDQGPARIVDSNHKIIFTSTYARCIQYLEKTGCRRI